MMSDIVQGYVGMKVKTGQEFLTKSGNVTTPVPSIDLSSERKAQNSVKRMDEWLIRNARLEAERREDVWNQMMFATVNEKRPTQADKDMAEDYLFGQ